MSRKLKQMQIRFKRKKGYITVYLTLLFGVLLPIPIALTEGAAAGASRLQAELVADLGIDSCFAEYHKELLRQYGLFFIDDSYGTPNGSVSQVEKHLEDYLSYNTAEEDSKKISGYYNLQRLKKQYLEIEEVSFATDKAGEVWKAQAVAYMKAKYGAGVIESIKNSISTAQDNGLLTQNPQAEMEQKRQEIHDIVERKKEETEETGETVDTGREEESFSFDKLMDMIQSWRAQNLFAVVIPENESVSQMGFQKEKVVSYRYPKNLCNEGSGLVKDENTFSWEEELLYNAFLLEKYGCFTKSKEDSCLSYEMEYILFGKENDYENLQACIERLTAVREVSNFLYLNTKDPVKKGQVKAVCTAICSFCMVPELSDALTQVTLGLWAYGESLTDVKCLLNGGKVPLIKEKGEWNLTFSSLLDVNSWRKDYGYGSKKATALSYTDYLAILLGCMDKEEKTLRSMDIVELDIRKTAGNKDFRLDQCIDSMLVSFGFTDQYRHNYVFTRYMRYE